METIRMYLENMFMQLPKTPEVLKAKEELLNMMEDKYNELKRGGRTENEAVGIVISEFGNLEELAEELGLNAYMKREEKETANYSSTGKNDEQKREPHQEQYREQSQEQYQGQYQEQYREPYQEQYQDYEDEGFAITLDQAAEYLDDQRKFGSRIGLGVFLCICSPALLILFSGMEDLGSGLKLFVSGPLIALGLTCLFVFVAAAVCVFVFSSLKVKRYEPLKTERFHLEMDAEAYVRALKEEFAPSFNVCIALGVVLCILSAVPLCVTAIVVPDGVMAILICVALLLVIVGAGVYLFIYAGMRNTSYKVLLQEEEYSAKKKVGIKAEEKAAAVYWPLVTCIYLTYSFATGRWGTSWILWIAAGALFEAVSGCFNISGKRRK